MSPLPEESRSGDVDLIRTATSHTFDALVLKEPGPVVVEFMSYGCAHCRQLEPVLQQVAVLVTTKEKLFRVNVAVESTLADSYQIGGTPTLIMFLNGQEVGRSEGPPPTLPGLLTAVTQPFESR